MNPVQKRETFLIDVYSEYNRGRSAYNFQKSKRKDRAAKLLTELRNRYNANKVDWSKKFDFGSATAETITMNGKYSLD